MSFARRLTPALAGAIVAMPILVVSIPPAEATTTSVPCSVSALDGAISSASPGDTLSLAPGCTYTLTDSTPEFVTANGHDGLPGIGQDLTIEGNGDTITRSATANFRIFDMEGTANVTLEDLTISNGRSGGLGGGGIWDGSSGTVTVLRCTLSGNTASGSGNGGAINAANGVTGATLNITNSTITGSQAIWGGGIESAENSGSITINVTNSTFSNNKAGGGPGGAIGLATAGSGSMTVTGSTFTGNQAALGGAIGVGDDFGDASAVITNSTFQGNSANGEGGAIDIGDTGDGAAYVSQSTFVGNTASFGNAFDMGDFGGNGALVLGGNLIAGASPQCGTSASVGTHALEDEGYDIASDGTCLPGGATGSSIDANLANEIGPLRHNGGPTETMAPQNGNPGINAIPNPTTVTGAFTFDLCPGSPATDQRGVTRPQQTNCEVGAVELTPLAITTTHLPPAAIGENYQAKLVATGGIAPYTWTATGTPAWLNVTAKGALSGIPPGPPTSVTPTFTVTDSNGTTLSTPLTIDIVPVATVSPTSYTFPGTNVGSTSSPERFVVTNNGTQPLTFGTVHLATGRNFKLGLNSCTSGATLGRGASCRVQVLFTPKRTGPLSDTLVIPTSANEIDVTVSGTGV